MLLYAEADLGIEVFYTAALLSHLDLLSGAVGPFFAGFSTEEQLLRN
jgi:hypothetical protein